MEQIIWREITWHVRDNQVQPAWVPENRCCLTNLIFYDQVTHVVDGGRLLFLLIELVIRRPVNPKYEGIIHTAGFLVLMGLMLVVTFSDVGRLIGA